MYVVPKKSLANTLKIPSPRLIVNAWPANEPQFCNQRPRCRFFFFCCLEATACDGGKMELVERNDRHVDFILEQNLNLWANSLTWLTGNYGAIATAAISDVHVD